MKAKALNTKQLKIIFEEEAGQTLIEDKIINLFSFNIESEEILQWIH